MKVKLAAVVAAFVIATLAAPAARAAREAEKTAPPAGQDDAKATLEKSPRHGEYVDIRVAGGEKPLRAWIVYPERKDKAPVVVIIHEIFGLSDWVRAVADRLAADGFIAVAPDLLTGKGPGGGGTDSVASRDDVVKLIRALTRDEVMARLDAAREWGVKLPAASGKVASLGFCWGGGYSFAYAATPGLSAAVVYYGSSPETDALAKLAAPVLGLYGADDARVTATIEPAAVAMKTLGKTYEVEIFDGAGHGFLRDQAGRDGANLKAALKAWPRTLDFLRKHTGDAK